VSSGLRERIVTALAIAAVIIGVLLFAPPYVAAGLVVVVIAAGAWEWAGFAGLATPLARGLYSLAILGALGCAGLATAQDAQLLQLLRFTAVWWLCAFVWLVLASQRGGHVAAGIVGFLVLVPAGVSLARIAMLAPLGRELLLYLVVVIAAADVGAYFGGRSFGRHKLAPRVSPGKTWEGFVAGMLGAAIAAVGGAVLFEVPARSWVVLCMAVALVSVVGDLVESMFKRRAGLKDSGNLLPGHGGVLDRIDSLTAAAPTFLLGLYSVGVPA
jgi:phosphatidate cytidylyltransferase